MQMMALQWQKIYYFPNSESISLTISISSLTFSKKLFVCKVEMGLKNTRENRKAETALGGNKHCLTETAMAPQTLPSEV